MAALDPLTKARAQRFSVLDAQAEWDKALSVLGLAAERPLSGESARTYDVRHLQAYKRYDAAWKPIDMAALDDTTLRVARESVFKALEQEGKTPTVPVGHLREIVTRDKMGRPTSTFHGSPSAWMNRFAPNRRYVTSIRSTRPDGSERWAT
jgi:hypothetical protein